MLAVVHLSIQYLSLAHAAYAIAAVVRQGIAVPACSIQNSLVLTDGKAVAAWLYGSLKGHEAVAGYAKRWILAHNPTDSEQPIL